MTLCCAYSILTLLSHDYHMISGDWAKLDDDKLSLVKEDQILKLSGGGDWQHKQLIMAIALVNAE